MKWVGGWGKGLISRAEMSKKNSYSSWTFQTLKTRVIHCLKMPRTKYPPTKCHTLEEHITQFQPCAQNSKCKEYRSLHDLHSHMRTYVKKTPRNSFHIFRQQGNFTALLSHAILFSTKCHIFHNIIFLCSNNTHVFHKPCVKM